MLDAVAATGCPLSQTLIVDVASTDGTGEIAASRLGPPQVRRLDVNEGPNPARNEALRQAVNALRPPGGRGRPADARNAHRAAARDERNDIAVCAPIVVYASQPDVIQYAGGGVHFICEAVNKWMDQSVDARGPTDSDIGAAPGAALLIDVEKAQAVGGFDERYFLGKEDGDFLHRLRIAGYRLREAPAARVLHDTRPRSTWLFEYQVRNRWHFLLRNYELRTLILLAPALAVHEVLQLAVLVLKGHVGAWFRLRRIATTPAIAAARSRPRAPVPPRRGSAPVQRRPARRARRCWRGRCVQGRGTTRGFEATGVSCGRSSTGVETSIGSSRPDRLLKAPS